MHREANVSFFRGEISYCGYVIDKHSLHKKQEKSEVVLRTLKPENMSQLRFYLGLVIYYHKFLSNLATTLHLPSMLLRTVAKWE